MCPRAQCSTRTGGHLNAPSRAKVCKTAAFPQLWVTEDFRKTLKSSKIFMALYSPIWGKDRVGGSGVYVGDNSKRQDLRLRAKLWSQTAWVHIPSLLAM